MSLTLGQRLVHGWNAFLGKDPNLSFNYGTSYSVRPDRTRFSYGNERSIVSTIYNRIGIDVAAIPLRHVRLDQNETYVDTIDSGLNNCLKVEANIDQTARGFIQDIVMSMCDESVVAIVPVDTTSNPSISGSFDIVTMRTGKILEWMPAHIRVSVYNDRVGRAEELVLSKKHVGIIENPLYAVMNEPNSTLKRLIHKLNLLDAIDDQSGSGKLDLLISLPYVVKTQARKEQADKRRAEIEEQLADGKYGIAYIDGTEKVTQLNRPAENNLMAQVEFLTRMLYSQSGISQEVLDGTADEKIMINYHVKTIEPMLSAIGAELDRKFITKTARSQGQAIRYFRNPFTLVSATEIAEMSDSFTRNEILTSNEMRGYIGLKPSKEKGPDELRNKNLNPTGENIPEEKKENKSEERSEI